MHPIKIIILLVLGYLLYRLYMAGRKKRLAAEAEQGQPAALNDVLEQDPSCGTYVPRGQALRHRRGEREFFFCSEKCRQAFINNNDGG
ncbi:YHS domain-containing protein [Desulfurivibrio alkaliphilus]|uniref:TRASH domain protein n=1 Tax=Desulfurivibrio alkaliphilus (strain DSM 19089 / UNIQEM U267 / AHT2) TaxID=589865 RepID=D6Z6C0_DESAT|nr:YHS domain-containing protein [Desulfurivibrio alkaliphilus]ADH86885.1 TRASH domain protein [Desulfurivibrio alkaliphilus AHT 2]